MSCHSVAVVLKLVVTKQIVHIYIYIHKRNNTKNSTNNTSTQ